MPTDTDKKNRENGMFFHSTMQQSGTLDRRKKQLKIPLKFIKF